MIPSTLPLFLIYGLSILSNITTETATGVLQVGGHYKSQALINFLQSVATAAIIVYAYFSQTGLMTVLMAYLTGKMILGLAPIVLALYWLPKMLGNDWLKAPFSLLPPKKEFIKFSLSTNFSSTINMVARDSEVLWVGYFFSPLEAGYFKTALAIINLVVMPITPFISTTYPEITRAVAQFNWRPPAPAALPGDHDRRRLDGRGGRRAAVVRQAGPISGLDHFWPVHSYLPA